MEDRFSANVKQSFSLFIPVINLARNIGSNYTYAVKSGKLIHALLIVALCYGQLIASVHLVGHLHDNHCDGLSHSVTDTCSIAQQTGEHLGHAHHSHQNTGFQYATHNHAAHQVNQTDEKTNAYSDCAIYHALLNLDGAVPTKLTNSSSPGIAESTSYVAIHIVHETLGAQRIRAPPHHS